MNKVPASLSRWWRIDALGLLALVGVSALCYAVIIYPALGNRRAYDRLQPQVNERTRQVQEARANLATLGEELERTQIEMEALPLRLESSTKVNSRLAGIADLASEMGLEVHQLLPDSVSTGQRYDVVPIVLTGAGDYAEVTRFMRRVHTSFADVSVVGFSLNSAGAGAEPARFDIGLAWYTLPAMGMAEN